jgi:hypothetical protein
MMGVSLLLNSIADKIASSCALFQLCPGFDEKFIIASGDISFWDDLSDDNLRIVEKNSGKIYSLRLIVIC